MTKEEYEKIISRIKGVPLEQEYFLWDGWDTLGGADYQFYSCELIKDFGEFKSGMKFPIVRVCLDQSLMEIFDSLEAAYPIAVFNLSLTLEQIKLENNG